MRSRHLLRTLPLAAAMILATAPPVSAAGGDRRAEASALAEQTLARMDAGAFADVVESFAPEARAAIEADTLSNIWQALPKQFGQATHRGTAQVATRGTMQVVTIPLHFERGVLNAIVTVDSHDRIAGLLLQPPAAPPASVSASALPAGVQERAVSVGDGNRALPGTLSLPTGNGPFPAVVLVHGSGPQDRDQTLGPNRPFLDIAHGLAARGIAVLRFDKRSRARPQDYAAGDFTVDDEVTDDAIAAILALRAVAEVDADRVFVLGHSLGGMMAPRIAARADAAGTILFAAPSRPLLDILVEQLTRMAMVDGALSDAERTAIDGLRAGIARIRADEDVPAAQAPLGQSTTYWRSIERVDPVAEAGALDRPLLVAHGGRDIQVTADDWRGWQAAFDGSATATLKEYPALSHLGIAGDGPGSLADYQTAGRVDDGLIDDIAGWIHEHREPSHAP